MNNIQLSVIIPVFNEINTIDLILKKVLQSKIIKQIIIVDDFSTDGTREFLTKYNQDKIDKIILHKKNLGKGAAIKSAQKYIEGKYVIIQDADLEYDPKDYDLLINEAEKNNLKAVYGSRVLNKDIHTNSENFSHAVRIWGNFFLTFLNNLINHQKLTDAHTCYKLFDSNLFKSIDLVEKDFSFCPEITTKLSNRKIRIKEVSINYTGRTYDEGKKISAFDGLKAIWVLIKYKLF
jgi:glycosyltransferase involved in cell wall biosynthesis